jgi:hypothetical protein
MALTFPAAPTNGDTHVVGSVTWTYTAANDTWVGAVGGGSSAALVDWQTGAVGGVPAVTTKSDGSPIGEGDQFWDSTGKTLYVYDATAPAWTAVGPSSGGGLPISTTSQQRSASSSSADFTETITGPANATSWVAFGQVGAKSNGSGQEIAGVTVSANPGFVADNWITYRQFSNVGTGNTVDIILTGISGYKMTILWY